MENNRSEFGNGLIWLEEPKSIFYSGQVVNGKLNFELNKPLKILCKYYCCVYIVIAYFI